MRFFAELIPLMLFATLLGGLLLVMMRDTRACRVRARTKALDEATDALRSLAKTAKDAMHKHERDGRMTSATVAEGRAYYYGRAADMVASIPKDRL